MKGQYDKAIADFTEVTRIDPSSAFAYGGRAIAWQMKREHHKAIDDFTEAIRLDPTNVNLIDLLATAYAAVGNFDAAVEWKKKQSSLPRRRKRRIVNRNSRPIKPTNRILSLLGPAGSNDGSGMAMI